MGAHPDPPRPPAPPSPPRAGSNTVAIALLVLALISIAATVAVWVGLRLFSRTVKVNVEEKGGVGKTFSIQTPVGSLDVAKEVRESDLRLPLYPGATRVRDKNALSLNFDFPGNEGVRVLAAKYETLDALERVVAFYKEHLGSEVTKFIERDKDDGGKTVFEIKRGGQEKVVALRSRGLGTEIELVRVQERKDDTN